MKEDYMFEKSKKLLIVALLLIIGGLGYILYSVKEENRTMKKDMILHYVFQQEKATRQLEEAMDSVQNKEKFRKELVKAREKIDSITKSTGNVMFIGRHAEVPTEFFRFNFKQSSPVGYAIEELENNELTQVTLNNLKSYVQTASTLTSRMPISEFEGKSLKETRDKLASVNESMEKYEIWPSPSY